MSPRWLKPVLLSSALVLGTSSWPALAPADTLTDALIKAYQLSPLLNSSQAALRALDENVPQARAERRPQLDGSVSASRAVTAEAFNDRIENATIALDASLLLYDNGRTKAAIESALARVAAGRADLNEVSQFVFFNAVEAYANVRRDEQFVNLASNDVDRLDETLSATRTRFEVGEVTRTDVSQSEARLANSRSILAAAEGELAISREAYRAAVGVPPRDLQPLPPLPEVPEELETATAIGLQRNPRIVSAQFLERAAVYDFDRALAAKGPTLSAGAQVGMRRGTTQFGDYDGDTFGEVSIRGGVPLYTGGLNDSLVRQAQAVLNQRRFEVQDTAREVTQNVAAAWAQLEVARVTIVARRQQAEASRIAAEGVAEEARLGARSTLDVLNADQERLQAEAEIVRSIRDEYVAAYGLLQSMGLLTIEHLGLPIDGYDPDVNFTRVQSAPIGGYDTSVVDRIRSRWER